MYAETGACAPPPTVVRGSSSEPHIQDEPHIEQEPSGPHRGGDRGRSARGPDHAGRRLRPYRRPHRRHFGAFHRLSGSAASQHFLGAGMGAVRRTEAYQRRRNSSDIANARCRAADRPDQTKAMRQKFALPNPVAIRSKLRARLPNAKRRAAPRTRGARFRESRVAEADREQARNSIMRAPPRRVPSKARVSVVSESNMTPPIGLTSSPRSARRST